MSNVDIQLAQHEERLKSLGQVIEALGPAVGQVAVIQANQETFDGKLDDFKEWMHDLRDDIGEVRDSCQAIRDDQASGRRTVLIALLSVGATIVAAMIAAAVALVTHFTPPT